MVREESSIEFWKNTMQKRIDGAHCYEFFAGSETFNKMVEEELGTFY